MVSSLYVYQGKCIADEVVRQFIYLSISSGANIVALNYFMEMLSFVSIEKVKAGVCSTK